ncbi:MAG: STAS domain-containing protein [Candidatus Saccharimonadales bacterium]
MSEKLGPGSDAEDTKLKGTLLRYQIGSHNQVIANLQDRIAEHTELRDRRIAELESLQPAPTAEQSHKVEQIIPLSGQLDIYRQDELGVISSCLDDPIVSKITVDLSQAESVDAAVLSTLVSFNQRSLELKKELVLLDPPKPILEIFSRSLKPGYFKIEVSPVDTN